MKKSSYFSRFLFWWGKQKMVYFVLISFVLYFVIMIVVYNFFSLCLKNIDESSRYLSSKNFDENSNYFIGFIISCVASPFLETIIFQNILVRFTRRYISKKEVWQVLLPALCFGLIRHFNLFYILSGIIIGIFFTYCFILYEKHTDTNRATIAVTVTHAFINCVPFFKNVFLNVLS